MLVWTTDKLDHRQFSKRQYKDFFIFVDIRRLSCEIQLPLYGQGVYEYCVVLVLYKSVSRKYRLLVLLLILENIISQCF